MHVVEDLQRHCAINVPTKENPPDMSITQGHHKSQHAHQHKCPPSGTPHTEGREMNQRVFAERIVLPLTCTTESVKLTGINGKAVSALIVPKP